MSLQIAQAAVDDATIHFDKLYSYCIPPRLNDKVWPGSMVLVPFGRGNKPRMAVVLSVAELPEGADTQKLKTLYDAAPAEARLTPDLLELVRFLKDRTFCTWFEAVKAVIPYGAQYRAAVENGRPVMQNRLSRSTERLYTLAGELPAKPKPGPRQLAAMEALSTGPKTARQLDEAGISKATLDALCKKGVLTVAEQDKSLDLFADIPFDPQPLTLSEEQQKAFAALLPDLEDDKPHAALLHGVTGSGKTVVFLKLIERTLELGRRPGAGTGDQLNTADDPPLKIHLWQPPGGTALGTQQHRAAAPVADDPAGECRHRGRHPQRGLLAAAKFRAYHRG